MEARSVAYGERKNITAMFADIKGSVELMVDLDPEDARSIVDPALEIMMEAVHRYEGYVARPTGDGIFALFGAPIACEDHARRAVHAALRMQQEIRRYTARLRVERGLSVQIRVGLNTGEVVLRSIRKDDLHTEYDPVGHSTNLAARMEALARPDSILVSESTYSLAEGYFEFRPLGMVPVKGVREPMATYEVIAPTPERTPIELAARRGLVRFVGRERELAEIERALDLARQGRGHVVAVVGDPGVGKSRLFYEMKPLLARDSLLLETSCVAHGKATPYLPLISLLHSYFEIRHEDDEATRREKLRLKVVSLDPALEGTLPYLHHLLGVAEPAASLRQMDPRIRRQRVFAALAKVLLRESSRRHLALVVEDLQWMDGETEAFLTTVADSTAESPLLLLVNYRPEYRPRWGSRTEVTQLRLDPLAPLRAAELVATLLGEEPATLPLRRLVLEKTQGNPFFIQEIVQGFFAQGILDRGASGISLARALADLQIPATVQGVLAARIDRLRVDQKNLLHTLAVIGPEFDLRLIERVAGPLDEGISELLTHLADQKFIDEAVVAEQPGYRFKHALTQEVAYNSLLRERRRVVHEEVAQAIEALFADRLAEHSGELAYHYGRSGNTAKTIEYLRMAANRAVERSALAEAIGHLRSALSLVAALPPAPERLQLELSLHLALGTSLGPHAGWYDPDVGRSFGRAREICHELGETPQLFQALFGLWVYELTHGNLASTRELAEQLWVLGERFENRAFLVEACRALGPTVFFFGEFSRAREILERGFTLYDPVEHRSHAVLYGQDPKVLCLTYRALVCHLLGDPARGRESLREAVALAEAIAHPFTSACAGNHTAILGYFHRDVAEVEPVAERTVALATEHGFPFWLIVTRIIRDWAIACRGDPSALDEMRRDLDTWRVSGAAVLSPWLLAMLGEALATLGKRDEALGVLDEAARVGEETGARWWSAEIHRLTGEVELSLGNASRAQTSLDRALEIARRQGAKTLELRATATLARLLRGQGKGPEARRLLEAAYHSIPPGFDTADLSEAKGLFEDLTSYERCSRTRCRTRNPRDGLAI